MEYSYLYICAFQCQIYFAILGAVTRQPEQSDNTPQPFLYQCMWHRVLVKRSMPASFLHLSAHT